MQHSVWAYATQGIYIDIFDVLLTNGRSGSIKDINEKRWRRQRDYLDGHYHPPSLEGLPTEPGSPIWNTNLGWIRSS